ncbi:MAG: amidohydrolase, partial [Anaerolineae bacterium]|nr:amidohydrolase [Anaerolineae bacterium]
MIEHILYNGNIITLDDRMPRVSALAISGGRIVAYGSDDEVKPLAMSGAVLENLGGKTVIPGLTDAHIHWQGTARAMHEVNVFEVPDKMAAAKRVSERAAKMPPGQWITGHGWFQDIWPDRAFPTAADLDDVSPHHPVYLRAKSGHAGWVNSAALRLCGITADTLNPDGGEIVRDASGQPTGLLLENAMNLVAQRIPEPSVEQIADEMRAAQQAALASGLTGFHDYDEPSCLAALQILRERGELGLRAVKNINKAWLQAALDSGLRWSFGDDWIRIGGLKIYADGALGPRTASMIEPYDGEPHNYGIATIEKEEMADLVSRASAAGIPSTVHAIGDRAVHDVLDVYEAVRQEEAARGVEPLQRRHRIEHVQLIHPNDAGRLAQLGIIASMQPIHATSDYVMSDRYWGTRSLWAYNTRLQLDRGAVVAFGSDSPVDTLEPLKGIHAAVTRQRADGSPGSEGWYPALRLTVDEAVRGFTLGPAYASGMDNRLGKLAPGFLADLVVLDRDLYA